MNLKMFFGMIMAPLVSLQASGERTFLPQTLIKPLPAIENAPFVQPGEMKSIGARDLVLALTHNGHSRAYPINMLTGPRREIINDTLGGTPIAATW